MVGVSLRSLALCLLAGTVAASRSGSEDDLTWRQVPNAWHQQAARIVDHRFTTFADLHTFAFNAKKAGVSVLMLVQLQKSARCPGNWYNGLQLCDHINGSYPVDDGSLPEWQQMLKEIKPMRLMVWWNVDYWSVQGEVWQQAVADQTSDVGRWFSYGPTVTSIPKCDGNNVCFKSGSTGEQVCAQGSWGSAGEYSGVKSGLASFGSPTYAAYLSDAMANSWSRNLGIDGYTIDCSANYDACMMQTKHAQSDFYNGIVGKVRETQPQVVMSGEGYGSWDEVLKTNSQMGGQGFQKYHDSMRQAVLSGDASNLEDIASTSGADAATVVCYLHPGYDGKQPGGCPTMYFRDAGATITNLSQHQLWVALEAGSGIVSEHDFDTRAWWNVTNDPFDHEGQSPLWAFTKHRALNRLALRTKLNITSSMSVSVANADTYTEYLGENCYSGAGGDEIGEASTVSLADCKKSCDADPECDCIVFSTGSVSGSHNAGALGTCWKRTNCDPASFEKDAASSSFSVYVKKHWVPPVPPPSADNYTEYSGENSYNGAGGDEIGEPSTVSVVHCKSICDSDPECDCIVFLPDSLLGSHNTGAHGTCWKRTNCEPAKFEKDTATSAFSVYVKKHWVPPVPPPKKAGGALAYLKHDSMGPQGDAAIMVFNPGAAQSVTIDLSDLPADLLGGTVTPYDLLTSEIAGGPLTKKWTVTMRAAEVKAFGGFALGVFAPRKGKVAGCESTYNATSTATTLQGCFLDCKMNEKCENVLVSGKVPEYLEKPAPVTCTLLGAVLVPATSCTPGSATLINRLSTARQCASLWDTPTAPASGAPSLPPGPPCSSLLLI